MRTHPFYANDLLVGPGYLLLEPEKEKIAFTLKWSLIEESIKAEELEFIEEILCAGHSLPLINHYYFKRLNQRDFSLTMENDEIGRVEGKGFFDKEFVGFEITDRELRLHATQYYHYMGDGQWTMQSKLTINDEDISSLQARLDKV